MTPEQSLMDLTQREAIVPRHFDPCSAAPFANKSVSEERRRAHRREELVNFLQFAGGKHLADVVLRWRDHLRAGRKRSATISLQSLSGELLL